MSKYKILVSALEISSNIHLKALKKELGDDIKFVGIFDNYLGNPIYDPSQTAAMGFLDIIKKIPFLLKLKNKMVKLAKDVDQILLMDNSGFNLPLAKAIKKQYPKKEIIYYILPQAWAWREKRIPIIEKTCDKLCSILPFEKDYYKEKDKITYVGHPLLDRIDIFKTTITNHNKIAFMPGSRKSEIIKLMPIYKKLSQIIKKEHILIIPPHFTKNYINEVYGDISNFTISNNTYETLVDVDFAFICSGTATLEASLIGTPFVLNYIAKPLDIFIFNLFVKLKYVGLANILFEKMGKEPIHKEYLHNDVTTDNLLDAYTNIDTDKFLENAKILKEYLKYGSSKNVASIIRK